VDGTYQGLLGGVTFVGMGTVSVNEWTHLALVRSGGTTTLYVNGVASGSTSAQAPLAPSGAWAIAVSPPLVSAEYFEGLIDEVSAFTFAAGAFATTDLSYISPAARALNLSNDGTNVTLSWPTTRTDLQLQFGTDLTAGGWSGVSAAVNGSLNTFTQSLSEPRGFFRLAKLADPEAALTEASVVYHQTLVATGAKRDFTASTTVNAPNILNSASATFVMEANPINPRTGTNEGLHYHWTLSYLSVDRFSDIGISGYVSRKLSIDQTALASTNSQNPIMTLTLEVTDPLDPGVGSTKATFQQFYFTVNNGVLGLMQWSECQNPDGSNCTVPSAAPVPPGTEL